MRTGICLGLLASLVTYATPSFAIYNGIADSDSVIKGTKIATPGTHLYAGLLYYPGVVNGANKYLTCGATLVDSTEIPAEFKRRIAITAGHCIRGFNDDVDNRDLRVTFIANPGMVMDTTPPTRAPVALSNVTSKNSFAGHAWTPLLQQINGVGPGGYKDDYAVIVLNKDNPVPDYIVPQLMQLPSVGQAGTLIGSQRSLTLTGYGTIVWGNFNSTPTPTTDWTNQIISGTGAGNILGLRQKMTVEMKVISVNAWNIEESMNFAQGDGTACNGDSGSGFIDTLDPNAPVLLATVSQGDFNCRAVNTSTRIDTTEFYNFLRSTINKLNLLGK